MNRRTIQIIVLIAASILLLIHLIFSTQLGWKYWPVPLSMLLIIIGQLIGLRHEAKEVKEV